MCMGYVNYLNLNVLSLCQVTLQYYYYDYNIFGLYTLQCEFSKFSAMLIICKIHTGLKCNRKELYENEITVQECVTGHVGCDVGWYCVDNNACKFLIS
jgi:hypothetical protein